MLTIDINIVYSGISYITYFNFYQNSYYKAKYIKFRKNYNILCLGT